MASAAAADDKPPKPAEQAVKDAQKKVEAELARLKGAGAVVQPITDEAVVRAFPDHPAGAGAAPSGLLGRPVPRPQELLVKPCLRRARLRAEIVLPADHRRQRHQDRLGAAARLQAEQRAAVADQVEFDVPAAAELLEGPLPRGVRLLLAALRDRQVGFEEMVAAVLHEGEERFQVPLQIVEEDAADAARLVPVRQEEVVVAPLLEAGVIHGRAVALADGLPGAV